MAAGKRGKRVNSRLRFYHNGHLLKCKRSQITVFVIIAIAIVAVLLVLFLPNFKNWFVPTAPDVELSSCLKEPVKDAFELAMIKGGSINPQLYYMYEGETLDYLCYTRDYYSTCIMQKPLLKQSIENEVESYVQPAVKTCIGNMKKRLESGGYEVKTSGSGAVDVRIVPDNVMISLELEIAAKKDEDARVYDRFNADFKSEAYDMIMIASSIANWEAHYGEAAAESYMAFYPDMKIEKKKQSDGTKIYIITNTKTKEKLQFASRSLAWPAGYAA